MAIQVQGPFSIPDELITFRHVRASGPGGQNVNKVSNAIELRVDLTSLSELSAAARHRLRTLAGRRMNDRGELLITAQRYRSLEQNKADAIARLLALLRAALIEPKTRRKTRPTRAARERRLATKARQSRMKILRSKTPMD